MTYPESLVMILSSKPVMCKCKCKCKLMYVDCSQY